MRVKLGAKKDGTLTAIYLRAVSDTGAYGNHSGEVLGHSLNEPIALYRCPNKKADGYAVYTNTVPAGAFRGYGVIQTSFAMESAIDSQLTCGERHAYFGDRTLGHWLARFSG